MNRIRTPGITRVPREGARSERSFRSGPAARRFPSTSASWVRASLATLAVLLGFASNLSAQSSAVLFYQGRVLVGNTGFDGNGRFKFAIAHDVASPALWSNSPDTNADDEPDTSVTVPVTRGLYGIQLGDISLPNMAAIPAAVFSQSITGLTTNPLFLRVWFNDGTGAFERLAPDQRLSAVGFAMAATHAQTAASVADGSITAAKLAPGAITTSSLSGTLLPSQVPGLDATTITSGILDPARLPAQVALKTPDLRDATNALIHQIATLQSQLDGLKTQVALLGSGSGGSGGSGPTPGSVLASSNPADTNFTRLGYGAFASFPAGAWTSSIAANSPSARSGHAAVWAAEIQRMLVWGGQIAANTYASSGAIYHPATDSWQPTPTLQSPSPRRGHTIVWNGSKEAMVWGGFSDAGYLGSGARWHVDDAAWKPVSIQNAPSGRDGHVALWTGSSMLIWGGRHGSGKLGDGALYDPARDTWLPLALSNAPTARSEPATAWTGDRALIWGGRDGSGPINSGAQLLFTGSPPTASQWRTISSVNAPSPRTGPATAWTGSRWLVWGGRADETWLSDGASYDPVADAWAPLPGLGAPSARSHPVAAWTGDEFIVWGGDSSSGPIASGGAYRPASETWRALDAIGNPLARSAPTGIWSGTELILFGGQNGNTPVSALQRLTPRPAWHLYRKL